MKAGDEMYVCVYRKQNESVTPCETILTGLFQGSRIEYTLYTDQGIDTTALRRMKRDIEQTGSGVIVLSSVRALGVSTDDVLRMLQWAKNTGALLVAADTASSRTLDPTTNGIVLQTLIDVYASMPSSRITYFKVPLGRKKIQFPKNWDELYQKWDADQITAIEFMDQAGLKKGTFYHLLASYKEQQDSIKELRYIG